MCFLYFYARKKTGKLRWFFFFIWKYSVIDQILDGTFITVVYRSEPVQTKHHRLIATLPKFRVSTAPKLVERTLTESPWLMRQWRCEAKGDNYTLEKGDWLPQHAKRNSENAGFFYLHCVFAPNLEDRSGERCRCVGVDAHCLLIYPILQDSNPIPPSLCLSRLGGEGGREEEEEWGLPTSDMHRERPDMHSVSLLMCRDPRHDRN